MTQDEQKLRIKGLFVVMEGIVYREFIDQLKPNGHLVRPFPIPRYWPKWRLIDYGGSAPTAGLWAAMSPNEHVYLYREHYERGLSVLRNAEMIIAASGDEEYRATLIDPHAYDKPPSYYGLSPSVAEQYQQAGVATSPWPYVQVMGEHAMVQRVKFRLERRTIWVFENLINTRREFRSWKYDCDDEGRPKASDVFEKKNNHALDDIKGFLGTDPCYVGGKVEVSGGE
jgi:phage terminase large subunit